MTVVSGPDSGLTLCAYLIMTLWGTVPFGVIENFGPHLAPVTMMTGSEKALQFCPVAHFLPWGFCDEMPGEAYVQEGRQGSTPE